MTRAILTFLAVLSLTGGLVGSVASAADARTNNVQQQTLQRGDNEKQAKVTAKKEKSKDKSKDKCDDGRGKHGTPKACNGDSNGDSHGDSDHGDD